MPTLWALDANKYRLLLELTRLEGGWAGRLQNEEGRWEPLEQISVHRAENPRYWEINFFRNQASKQYYRLIADDRQLSGSFSHSRTSTTRPLLAEYRYSVVGWSPPPEGWRVGHP